MRKLLFLLFFIPLVFACSDDSNSGDVSPEIGDIYQGGIVFSLNDPVRLYISIAPVCLKVL